MLKITHQFQIDTESGNLLFRFDPETKELKVMIDDCYDQLHVMSIPFELATQIPRALEKLMDGE